MNMNDPDGNVLLIEDNSADAKLIREALTDKRFGPFQIEWVKNLSDGLERLSKGGIEAVLADLLLPDSQGIKTLDRILLAAPGVPILVISGLDDEGMASQAVQHGAKDYIPKSHLDSYTLSRALQNMIDQTEGITQNQVASEILALQTSLQASYQTTAMLSQLSLTKFLPVA